MFAAISYYAARRFTEALPLYERALDFDAPRGRLMSVPLPHQNTMRLALARRKTGDEDGAQAAAEIVRQDLAARRAAGRTNPVLDWAEAMIAAFDNDPERSIALLRSAVQRGLRVRAGVITDPIFDDLREEPGFVAIKQDLDALIADEHDKVLQLICFNNPVPNDWQPLPETCAGVVQQHAP